MNKTGVIIGLVVLLAVAIGTFALTRKSDKPESTTATTTSDTNNNGAQSQETTGDTNEATGAATLTYTDDGFNPSTITVKAGATITIKNNSSQPLQVSSNPHPAHTDEPELNLDTLSPGRTTTLELPNAGSYGVHNHLEESHDGTIIVQE